MKKGRFSVFPPRRSNFRSAKLQESSNKPLKKGYRRERDGAEYFCCPRFFPLILYPLPRGGSFREGKLSGKSQPDFSFCHSAGFPPILLKRLSAAKQSLRVFSAEGLSDIHAKRVYTERLPACLRSAPGFCILPLLTSAYGRQANIRCFHPQSDRSCSRTKNLG